MRPVSPRVSADREGSSPAVMVILLAAGVLASDYPLVSSLRGLPTDSKPRSEPVGYYEALINAPRTFLFKETARPPRGWVAFGGAEAGIVQEVPSYLRWEMRPNLNIRWNETVFQTNRHGFRSPEVDLKKPAGTYRIVVFGSSNTMGYGVDNDDIYTRPLERWLNDSCGPARQVEVVNLAVAGDSPTRRLARLQKEAPRWNADWLLCDATALDGWLEDSHIHAALQRNLPIPFPFVSKAVRRAGMTASDPNDSFRDKFRGESERMLPDVYALWSAESRRLRVPLTVVILPRADSKAKSPRVFELVRSLAVQNALDYLDLTDAFDDLRVEEFRNSEWDPHPSARGHQAIFETMRKSLLQRGGLPGLTLSNSAACNVSS